MFSPNPPPPNLQTDLNNAPPNYHNPKTPPSPSQNPPPKQQKMDMSSTPSPPMSGMNSIFYTSTTTPLYSSTWTPTRAPAYAGTCIFLVLLAALFRLLLAGRTQLSSHWRAREHTRRYIVPYGRGSVDSAAKAEDASHATLVSAHRGVEEAGGRRTRARVAPWRWSVDAPRAAYGTVVVGVGYLL